MEREELKTREQIASEFREKMMEHARLKKALEESRDRLKRAKDEAEKGEKVEGAKDVAENVEQKVNEDAPPKSKRTRKPKKKKKNMIAKKEEKEMKDTEEEIERAKDAEEEIEEAVHTVTFDIESHLVGEGLYNGTIKSTLLTISRSFIQVCPSQINNIDELIDIASDNRYLATVSDLVDVGNGPMLVVERGLKPIRSYFKESADYHSRDCSETGRSKWWKHISQTFKQIFGDIVHGLIYLNSMGHKGSHFYVSGTGEGKVLPLMDKDVTEARDVKNLIDIMTEIITLPFPEPEVDDSYKLPDDLTYMLQFVTEDTLDYIPFYWLINQSYFWSKDEKIAFVKDFSTYIKQDVFPKVEVDKYLVNTPFAVRCGFDWSSAIDPSVCGGLFQLIYDKPNTKKANVASYISGRFLDVVRYCTKCYNHGNDDYYRAKISMTKGLHSQHEIEEYLRSFFPMLYTDLYGALYYLASFNLTSNDKTQLEDVFQHWSRSYFA